MINPSAFRSNSCLKALNSSWLALRSEEKLRYVCDPTEDCASIDTHTSV